MQEENRQQKHTIQGLRVQIERDLCIGSGNCVNLAPEVFELDEQNLVAFRDDVAEAAIEGARLEEACAICPVDALLAWTEDGEQVVP